MLKWELGVWGDEKVHLYYEDAIHGKDIDIVLNQDGTVTIEDWAGEVPPNPHPDLIGFLRARAIDEIAIKANGSEGGTSE